jgi:hypothetical protein
LTAGTPAFNPANELQRDAELLVKYWVLAIPTAVASLVMVLIVILSVLSVVGTGLAGYAAGGHTGTALGLGSGILIAVALLVAGAVILYVAQAMSMAASPAVLADQPPNLGTALRVTLARLPDLTVASLACFALAIVPLALSIVLIGLPLLVILGYFLMYVLPAVIVGGEGGIEAIKTSFRITTTRVGESLIGWLGMILALVAGSIANTLVVHIPIVNLIAGFAIGGFTSAYAALLGVSFYLGLRGAAPVVQTPPVGYGGPPSVA